LHRRWRDRTAWHHRPVASGQECSGDRRRARTRPRHRQSPLLSSTQDRRPAGRRRAHRGARFGRRYFARNPIGSAAFCARPPVVTIILPVVLRSHRSIATVPDSAESTRRSARSLVAGLEWASRARAHDVMSASAVTWPAPARCYSVCHLLCSLYVECGRHATALHER
jgi:hypothetical protein